MSFVSPQAETQAAAAGDPNLAWNPDPKAAAPTPASRAKTSSKASPQESAAQKVEDTKKQLNTYLSGLTMAQLQGPGASQVAQKVAGMLGSLPYNDAQQIMNSNPFLKGNTPLAQAVTSAIQAGPTPAAPTAAKPSYDPLALQTMWHDVFGPAWQQASKIAGNAGTGYMDAMKNAIAGSNLPPGMQKEQTANATAMGNLLNQFGQNQSQMTMAGPSYDQLIAALGQATGAAQLAQGSAEKSIAYGQAAPFITGSTSTSTTNPLSSVAGAQALLNQSIAGGQTSSAPAAQTATNPLYPNIQ
jgi:hypothetical protein